MKKHPVAGHGENSMISMFKKSTFCLSMVLFFWVINGATFITKSVYADDAAVGIEYAATNIPWSGYWWPHDKCGLADGEDYLDSPSPLEKYELYTKAVYPSTLTQWYKETYCDNSPLAWYGHCGHWALAASSENIDFLPSVVNNIVFGVGDKKGLLTLAHNDDTAISGQGSNPEDFHYWLLNYIKGDKKSFVADLSVGEEIWQFPIYKFEFLKIEPNGDRESIKVRITYSDDNVHPDYIGSSDLIKIYEYDLLLNSSGEIIDGEWQGNSVDDHPEAMFLFLSQGTSAPSFDYNIVKQIIETKDDELESGTDAVELPPGLYNLILLDQDTYILDSHIDDKIITDIQILKGGGYDLSIEIKDKDNNIVVQDQISVAEGQVISSFISENPPYTLSLTSQDYSKPGIYSINFDLYKKQNYTIPYIPKSGQYSGFAITNNSSETREKVNVVAYSEEGEVIQTLMGPMDIASGEKQIFIFRNLPYRDYEYSAIDSLRIISDEPLGVVNVMRNTVGQSAGIDQGRYKGSSLVIPDTAENMSFIKSIKWRITNDADHAASFTMNLYNPSGTLSKTTNTISLEPRQSFHLTPGIYPFYSMPDSGWIEVTGVNGDESLSVYQQTEHYQGGGMETLFASPVQNKEKILPHIPEADFWSASVSLINTENESIEVRFHPVMAGDDTSEDYIVIIPAKSRTDIDLHEVYNRKPTDKFYRSIISLTSVGKFVGYYKYESSEFNDITTLPLLEDLDLSSVINLVHNTGSGGYWTGICFFNPDNTQTISVIIKPYDIDGNAMGSLEKEIELAPGNYNATVVSNLFPDDYQNISFLKIESKNPDQKIGGFYLYGSSDYGLWGSNLSRD